MWPSRTRAEQRQPWYSQESKQKQPEHKVEPDYEVHLLPSQKLQWLSTSIQWQGQPKRVPELTEGAHTIKLLLPGWRFIQPESLKSKAKVETNRLIIKAGVEQEES